MAVVLVVAAFVLAGLVLIVGLLTGSVVVVVVAVLGPLLAMSTIAFTAWLCRHRLRASLDRSIAGLAGPGIVRSMPPRDVLDILLSRVYGEQLGHEEITTALLGGGGRDLAGRDVAVSRATTADIVLQRIDSRSCLSEVTWSHQFSGVWENHRLVIFATSATDIFTLLTSRRVYPLFEAWLVRKEELEDFVPGIKDRLAVGISYRDVDGAVHIVEPMENQGEEVAFRDYDDYVRLPDRLDRQELRIFQVDLYDLADPDHVVEAVDGMTLRASSVFEFDTRFITWSAPHPCFVDKVLFDVRRLALPHEHLTYQVLVHTVRISYSADPVQGVWAEDKGMIEVTVRSWMLPGHGVTLLWRPVDGTESRYGAGVF